MKPLPELHTWHSFRAFELEDGREGGREREGSRSRQKIGLKHLRLGPSAASKIPPKYTSKVREALIFI